MIKPLSELTHIVYVSLLKPAVFKLDPEMVHNFFTATGQLIGQVTPVTWLTKQVWAYRSPQLETTFDGIVFPNPVGLSAGFDYNGDLTQVLPAVGFGFHTIGTVTWEPYAGNPAPRLGRLPKSRALLVNKGLKNIGVPAIIKKLRHQPLHIPTGISIGATNKHFDSTRDQLIDIAQSFVALENSVLNHAYYEMNISCPNTFGGEPFTQPKRLDLLLRVLDRLELGRPLYIKMPIDQSEAETIALLDVIAAHDTQGIILGNLTKDKKNPAVHPDDRKVWEGSAGNLSGKPTWERSNALIKLARQTYGNRFTIIGTGGVFTGEDAEDKLEAGADLVQLITGMIYNGPQTIGQINQYLDHAVSTHQPR